MNRLTRRNPDGAANFADADFESVCAELTPSNREKVRAIVDKLADWEDGKEYAESVLNEGGRLTTVDKDGNAELVNEDSLPQFYLIKRIGDAFEKLRAYEDAEEQGRLVRLPCRVGDTIYRLDRFGTKKWLSAYPEYKVYEYEVRHVFGDTDGINIFAHCIYNGKEATSYECFKGSDVGRILFLTLQEAEAALKGGGV